MKSAIKKALVFSFAIHLVGLFWGDILLKRIRPNKREIVYPVRLIEIAESAPKPVVHSQVKEIAPSPPPLPPPPPPKPEPKQKPAIVKKEEPGKLPEPKKGVTVDKKALDKKKEEANKVKEEKLKEEKAREEEKKRKAKKEEEERIAREQEAQSISQAIDSIKKGLSQKAESQSPLLSKEFIESQKNAYITRIDTLIKLNWRIPNILLSEIKNLEAIVVFNITKEGEPVNIRFIKKSGVNPFDESTVRAIKQAAPSFPSPPMELLNEEFEIRFYSEQMG
jgi:colicin import membrane protein